MRVLHWNILSKHLADGFLIDNKYLEIEYRLPIIIKKIKSYNPDIISLVEVHHSSVDDIVNNFPEYLSIYEMKTGEDSEDGCLILFKKEEFTLLSYNIIKYKDSSQIAIKCVFNYYNNIFVFISTHLKAKEEFRNKRIIQVSQLLEQIDLTIPCIITGDFNDTPDSNPIKLINHYNLKQVHNSEGHYTTYKTRKETIRRIIDYIFISPHFISNSKEVPDYKSFPETGCPTAYHPSDHIEIVSDISFI